ncbi:MAG: zf-TFIIB domain-containing protein [Candidatus Sumerlaeia bacterium]|nr:zf-TFIIB domain-containing protein [Candidatus Sumerlaeia bacterium]
MLCPVCLSEMIVLEMDRIEVDHCLRCKGVWLDRGELELLVEMSGAPSGPIRGALEGRGRPLIGPKRRCPVCGVRMDEVDVEGPAPVVVDRCPRRHGLWLDEGELGRLIESAGGAPETEAVKRLLGRLLQSERGRPESG